MPLPTIPSGNVFSSLPTGYNIDNSCRFNSADSAYMHRTFGTPTNVDKWTFSGWFKRGKVSTGAAMKLFNAYVDGNAYHMIQWSGGTGADKINCYDHDTSGGTVDHGQTTSGLYRDPSAWYHICVIYDSGNATATLRSRLFINGVEPSFSSDDNPSADQDSVINRAIAHQLGAVQTPAQYFDGYMAEVIFCDGQAYTPDNFGEYDSDSPTIWKPKDPSGLTFGDNGFWLDFEDSADLGKDVSGEGNHFTEVNFAATDQAVDSPTNSFCVMNHLDNEFVNATFSEGNNQLVIASGTKAHATSTMGVSAGKWYWEIECDASDGDDQSVAVVDRVSKDGSTDTYATAYPNNYVYQSQGRYVGNGEVIDSDPDSFSAGDIIGVALDLTNNKLYFAKNNTWQNSGDPTSGATGTGAISITAPSSLTNGFYFPAVGSETTSRGATWKCNFGGCSAFSVSSAANDGNGYGNFEYAPPSGYLALCSKNLGSDGG